MDKFEKEELAKKRPLSENCLYWLINYIPEPIKRRWDSAREKIRSLLKTNTKITNRSEMKPENL